jgi:hypothetical protein
MNPGRLIGVFRQKYNKNSCFYALTLGLFKQHIKTIGNPIKKNNKLIIGNIKSIILIK